MGDNEIGICRGGRQLKCLRVDNRIGPYIHNRAKEIQPNNFSHVLSQTSYHESFCSNIGFVEPEMYPGTSRKLKSVSVA